MQEKILNYWPKFLQSIEIWPKFWWFQRPDQTAETTFGTCINTCLILYVAMHFGFNLMLYVISKHIPLGNIHHTMLGSSLRGSFCVLTNTGSVVLLGSQGENQKVQLTLKYWNVMVFNTFSWCSLCKYIDFGLTHIFFTHFWWFGMYLFVYVANLEWTNVLTARAL